MGKSNLKKLISSVAAVFLLMPSLSIMAENNENVVNTMELIPKVIESNNVNKYEEVKASDTEILKYNIIINNDISQDEKEKMEAMNDFKILVPKTEANFEVALAYSDGSYSYKESADTLDEAMEKVKVIEKDYTDNSIIPCLLNSDGQVIYTTNSMGRIWNHRDGNPILDDSEITYLYKTPELALSSSNPYTYIDQLSIDDVPIIEDRDTTSKIQVNGFTGWINRDVASGNYDLVVVPINQVTNPSCYLVKNGELYHYISTNITFDGIKGSSIRVGIAPSYLKEGIDYYSYDGIYFYEGKTIVEGLTRLITDLKNNTNVNSINSNNPNYNYYEYLPFRTKSNYTADELNTFINNNTSETSKLRGLGEVLIECQNKYGVNPILTLGVAINESDGGDSEIAQLKNNIFGINAINSNPGEAADVFSTPSDCVIEFTENQISRAYADPGNDTFYGGYLGNKQLGANVEYASDPFWGEKAAQYAFTIDYKLSNNDIKNLKDNNGYQLAIYTGINEVKDINGTLLYNINPTISGYGGYAGNIVALKFSDETNTGKYRMFPEVNSPIYVNGDLVKYHGNYDFSSFAYINSENVKLINTPNNEFIPGYYIEDTNRDEKVDVLDLAEISVQYNKITTENNFKKYLDLNIDGMIDIFDIVKASLKIGA